MNRIRPMFFAVLAVLAVSGCSTPEPREKAALDQARADDVARKAEAERLKARQADMERQIGAVPGWALQPPKPDASGVYATGIAESDSMVIATRKAMLEAEFGLAKLYGQELSGSERSKVDEDGRAVNGRYQGLIDKLVARVPVVGFEVVQQEVKPVNGAYHAYVLLKLPYSEFNRVLQEQRAGERDRSFQGAFADLEKRVQARQKERRGEELASSEVASASASAPLPAAARPTMGVATANAALAPSASPAN